MQAESAVDLMRTNPEIPVTLIRGCCMICPPCPDYNPATGLCSGVESMSLRDEKKDLDVLQALGLEYGDTLPARKLLNRLFEEIHSTTQICGFGDGVARSPEWSICCGPEGSANYLKACAAGLGVPGVAV